MRRFGHAATRLSPLGRSVVASGFSHSARASLAFRPLGPTSGLKHVGVAEVRRIPHERVRVIGQPDGVGPRGQEFKAHAFEWLKPLATAERPKGESRATLQRRVQFMALPVGARLVVWRLGFAFGRDHFVRARDGRGTGSGGSCNVQPEREQQDEPAGYDPERGSMPPPWHDREDEVGHEQRDRGESNVDKQHHGELNVSKWNVKHFKA